MESRKPRIVVTMPAYRAEVTLAKTLYDIPPGFADEVIVVDDASPDRTVEVARELGLRVEVHTANKGYGGNQKTCYDLALADGADIIVLLHPDYQYDPKVLPDLVKPLLEGRADFTFGSRFRKQAGDPRYGDPLRGGMPIYRYLGNIFTTVVENLVLRTKFTELHSGLKAYNRRFLEELDYHAYDDKFVFDSQMVIEAVLLGYRLEEVPIPTRYTEESSSVSIKNSLVYIARTFETLFKTRLNRNKLIKTHQARLEKLKAAQVSPEIQPETSKVGSSN
ncbi:MAG TPA: glycosyltransferase family 2 protein [Chloroflexia bacterium]|nr:glycosyltransferase family 2 protein [Chloroflexia bacterium]